MTGSRKRAVASWVELRCCLARASYGASYLVLIFAASLVSAAATAAQVASVDGRKQATAARVPSNSIRIDGRLDESVWALATPVGDFVQKEPIEGAPPTEQTEIRFLYDDDALYVGARMFMRCPQLRYHFLC